MVLVVEVVVVNAVAFAAWAQTRWRRVVGGSGGVGGRLTCSAVPKRRF